MALFKSLLIHCFKKKKKKRKWVTFGKVSCGFNDDFFLGGRTGRFVSHSAEFFLGRFGSELVMGKNWAEATKIFSKASEVSLDENQFPIALVLVLFAREK